MNEWKNKAYMTRERRQQAKDGMMTPEEIGRLVRFGDITDDEASELLALFPGAVPAAIPTEEPAHLGWTRTYAALAGHTVHVGQHFSDYPQPGSMSYFLQPIKWPEVVACKAKMAALSTDEAYRQPCSVFPTPHPFSTIMPGTSPPRTLEQIIDNGRAMLREMGIFDENDRLVTPKANGVDNHIRESKEERSDTSESLKELDNNSEGQQKSIFGKDQKVHYSPSRICKTSTEQLTLLSDFFYVWSSRISEFRAELSRLHVLDVYPFDASYSVCAELSRQSIPYDPDLVRAFICQCVKDKITALDAELADIASKLP